MDSRKIARAGRTGPLGAVTACPQCGKPLRLRDGKHGPFWGCSGYPKCTVTYPDQDGRPDLEAKPRIPAKTPGPLCEECQKPTVRRETSRGRVYYTCPRDRTHGPWWDEDGALGRIWLDKNSQAVQGRRPVRFKRR